MALEFVVGVGLAAVEVALAVWLLRVDPRRPAVHALSAFLVARAIYHAALGFQPAEDPVVRTSAYAWFFFGVIAESIALIYFVAVFPRPRHRLFRGRAPIYLGLAMVALAAVAVFRGPYAWIDLRPARDGGVIPTGWWVAVAPGASVVVTTFATLVFARDARERDDRSLVLLAAGLASLLMATFVVFGLGALRGGFGARPLQVRNALGLLAGLSLLAIPMLWRQDPRGARTFAALAAVGLAFGASRSFIDNDSLDTLVRLASGVVAASVLAWALLRHRLLDIDLKVKWTLRRGSVAAVFVVVFFVATESAAAFFGERTGSAYVGIIAAGLLLFALAPLQRAAERFADAAMPSVQDTPEWREARRIEVYRSAVRVAWSDGRLSREDEAHLAALTEELQLPPTRALALRHEVERELGVAT